MSDKIEEPEGIVPVSGLFRRSAYWQAWNRVIGRKGIWTYEILVSPINGFRALDAKEQLWPPSLKVHCTPPVKGDIEATELPVEIRQQLDALLGPERARELVEGDFALRFAA